MDAAERPSPTDVVSKSKRNWAVVIIVLILASLAYFLVTHRQKRDPGMENATFGLAAPAGDG